MSFLHKNRIAVPGRVCLPVLLLMILIGKSSARVYEVTVRGEVARPGPYSVQEGDRLSSLLSRSGGFTERAWLRGAVLTRKSARARQRKEIREIVAGIEAAMQDIPGNREVWVAFLGAIGGLDPLGRVPVRLAHPRLLKGSEDDLVLEEGDDLFIPPPATAVRVTGAVGSPGEIPARNKAGYKEYIRAAGGFAENADRDGVYLLKAEGTAVPLSEPWIRWNKEESRWEVSAFRKDRPAVEPGDRIVVPAKPGDPARERATRKIRNLLRDVARITGTAVDLP